MKPIESDASVNVNNDRISQQFSGETFGDGGKNSTDAQVVVAEPQRYEPLDMRLFSSAQSGVDSDLIAFLERPYMFRSISLSSTDTPSTFVNWRPLYDMLSNEPYASKLKGRYVIKADVRVILQVNATKFQAGRYILAWLPNGGSAVDAAQDAWRQMHRFSLCQITQLPHVEIDINKDSQVELLIPYVSFQQGFIVGSGSSYGDVGWVFLYPYQAVQAVSGSTTATGSVFLKLENIHLGGLCQPQMGWKGPRDVVGGEQKQVGPVESTLRKVSQTGAHLCKIPLLSEFAAPVKWAADIGANVASVWGFSRPTNAEGAKRVVQSTLGYGASHNVVDSSQPISLDAGNHVAVIRGVGGTDVDEMSIDYVKQIPAYWYYFPWGNTVPADTPLWATNVSPFDIQQFTDGVAQLGVMSPVSFCSSMFQLWRGSMTYIFKVVKTDFHSGRLLVSFTPYTTRATATTPTFSNSTSAYLHREVWDIREKSEFRVTVPFVCEVPWLQVHGTTNCYSGRINISVLDPLVAPTTVSSSISIIVEACGGPDMQFAVPIKTGNYTPTVPYTQQMDWSGPKDVESGMLGNSELSGDGLVESQACIGEKIISLRSFLKRYSTLYTSTNMAGIVVNPYQLEVGYVPDATHPAHLPIANVDMYTYIGCCYAMGRGGARIRVYGNTASTGRNLLACTLNWMSGSGICWSPILNTSVTHAQNLTYGTGNPLVLCDTEKTSGLEVTVPQYHYSHARSTASHICNSVSQVGAKPDEGVMAQARLTVTSEATMTNPTVFRAGADDCSFHCFVSVPPMSIVLA